MLDVAGLKPRAARSNPNKAQLGKKMQERAAAEAAKAGETPAEG